MKPCSYLQKSSGSQSTSSSFTDSILFSSRSSHAAPPKPEFHRQEIPPHTLIELRLACAAIVKETGPTGAELEAILNQTDPLEQYKKEEQHRKDIEKIRLQAARTHATAFPPVRGARERDRLSKSNLGSINVSSTSLISSQPAPKQPSHRPLIPAAPLKNPIESTELESQSLRRPLSRKPVPHKQDERLAKAKSQLEVRIKSGEEAIHQHGRTEASSTSTTRSNTTADNHASTNQTSFAHTPAIDNQRRSLQYPPRSSSQTQIRPDRQNDPGSVASDIDFFAPNPDYEVPSLYHVKGGQSVPSRARSRAGSIKDSIIGGIRDYMQPRSSMDRSSRPQSRQSRTATRDSSKTPSRTSSVTRNSKEWMRNAANSLRRKGSISSMISQRGNDDGDDRGRKKDKTVDLNRQLPPLPGLDSYKEPKKHIAQLLARSKFSSKSTVEPMSPTQDTASTQTASQSDLSTQTITVQTKASPDSASSKQFPRIPFAETFGEDAIDNTRPLSSSKQSKRSTDPLNRHQEDELRRVVREKIQQGGLSKEAFDVQNKNDNLKRAKTVKQNSWELEQMEAGYISTSQGKISHQRGSSVSGSSTKKGFRGRFSKLIGHGPTQSSVIASH